MPKELTRAIPVEVPTNLQRIRVVLVEPSHPGNIGAVARAMKGMGLSRLVLVNPVEWHSSGDAWRLAKNSREVLRNSVQTDSLDEALDGVQFLVGTTHRRRSDKLTAPIPVREAMLRAAAESLDREVAVLFGPENFGLTSDHLSRCHEIASVPMATKNPSLNLSQAVMICAYELFVASLGELPSPEWQTVSVDEMERFYGKIERLMRRVEFVPFNDDWRTLRYAIRRAFGRTRIEPRDLAMFYQLFAEIERYLERKLPTSAER